MQGTNSKTHLCDIHLWPLWKGVFVVGETLKTLKTHNSVIQYVVYDEVSAEDSKAYAQGFSSICPRPRREVGTKIHRSRSIHKVKKRHNFPDTIWIVLLEKTAHIRWYHSIYLGTCKYAVQCIVHSYRVAKESVAILRSILYTGRHLLL